MSRADLEARWLDRTRGDLPRLAKARGWPVRNDHCFPRILLDAVHGGRWTDHVTDRPAYRHMDIANLEAAVALAEALVRGEGDLHALNAQSLGWRGKQR